MPFWTHATIRYAVKATQNQCYKYCLFQACDTVDNIDEEVYEQMSQCAAYVLEVIKLIKS